MSSHRCFQFTNTTVFCLGFSLFILVTLFSKTWFPLFLILLDQSPSYVNYTVYYSLSLPLRLWCHMRLLLHRTSFSPCFDSDILYQGRPPTLLHCEDSFLTLLRTSWICLFHILGLWYSVLGSPPMWDACFPHPAHSLTVPGPTQKSLPSSPHLIFDAHSRLTLHEYTLLTLH